MNAPTSTTSGVLPKTFGLKTGFMVAAVPTLPVLLMGSDPEMATTAIGGLIGLGIGMNVADTSLIKNNIAKCYTPFVGMYLGMTVGTSADNAPVAVMSAVAVFASVACARGFYVCSQQFKKYQGSFDTASFVKGAAAGVALSSALALGMALNQGPLSPVSAAPAVPAPIQP